MKLTIENVIEERLLLKQGKYVQTCAHIEKILWMVLLQISGLRVEDLDELHELMQHRKSTAKLRSRLKKLSSDVDDAALSELSSILEQIDDEIDSRHMAVHGAWQQNADGKIHCEYYKNLGTAKNPNWQIYADPISEEEIDYALQTVDDLLKRSWEVCKSVDAVNKKETLGISRTNSKLPKQSVRPATRSTNIA
ncbi:hypothetical protein [Roseovarius rhodophyticola]|uniref:HEPN AbiU2-like domain-containing protein n=1 Tax=Roseovarius rhodophyticola TaxID=3080827 RepID=A0ABZ2TG82_9RHOB|nr:hypothetical protein [Roseovarius sp. W115]MDV2928348.1 hypothetical protein [Roseovarius sp. W115]